MDNIKPEAKKLIKSLAKDFKPIIDKIEAKPETTRNHYGDYMSLLSQFNSKDAKVVMLALTHYTNANKQGLKDAYKLQFNLNDL